MFGDAEKGANTARQRGAEGGSAIERQNPEHAEKSAAPQAGKTQQEITAACKGARPNHVGVVIARHKRTGRIELRDRKVYATQSDPGSSG